MSGGRTRRKRILRIQHHQMCPACLDRDAINLIGRPRFVRGNRKTARCELCHGRGEVSFGWDRGEKPYDPWVVTPAARGGVTA